LRKKGGTAEKKKAGHYKATTLLVKNSERALSSSGRRKRWARFTQSGSGEPQERRGGLYPKPAFRGGMALENKGGGGGGGGGGGCVSAMKLRCETTGHQVLYPGWGCSENLKRGTGWIKFALTTIHRCSTRLDKKSERICMKMVLISPGHSTQKERPTIRTENKPSKKEK